VIEGLVPFVVAVAVASQAPAAPRPPAVVIPPGKPTIVLWPDGAPGSEAHEGEPEQIDGETVLNVHAPSIIAFPPRPFDVEGLADMQRAIRTVRSRAAEFGVDPAKIGAAGFSAGGELAQLAALRHDAGRAEAADPVERVSSRPDFQVLIYPGKSALIQPVAGSPPAFLAAGYDDRPDISEGLAEA
jgi:hypothetical protein